MANRRILALPEILRKDYELVDPNRNLGEGTYGIVYKARDKKTKDLVAIKSNKLKNNCSGMSPQINKEIMTLQILQHVSKFSIGFKDFYYEKQILAKGNGRYHLVFDLLDMDLSSYIQKHIHRRKEIPLKAIKGIMFQLLYGCHLMHSSGVLHRDLKPANILVNCKVDEVPSLKIADVGISKIIKMCDAEVLNQTNMVVTMWYRAPEILLGETVYGSSIDMWSLGCIFIELFTKKVAFDGESEFDQLIKIFKVIGTPDSKMYPGIVNMPNWHVYPKFPRPEKLGDVEMFKKHKIDSQALEIISKLLEYDPKKRIDAFTAMNHPFFSDIMNSYVKIKSKKLEPSDLSITGFVTPEKTIMHNIKKLENKLKTEKKREPIMDIQLSTIKKIRYTDKKENVEKN